MDRALLIREQTRPEPHLHSTSANAIASSVIRMLNISLFFFSPFLIYRGCIREQFPHMRARRISFPAADTIFPTTFVQLFCWSWITQPGQSMLETSNKNSKMNASDKDASVRWKEGKNCCSYISNLAQICTSICMYMCMYEVKSDSLVICASLRFYEL